MPCPLSLAEMATWRGLQILQFNPKKRLDSFPHIFIPFHPFFPSIYLNLQLSIICSGFLVVVSIMLFMLMMQITMLVVWNDWGTQSIWTPTRRNLLLRTNKRWHSIVWKRASLNNFIWSGRCHDSGNDFYDSENCTWQSPWCICIFLSDKQFGRGTWKILVLPCCCGDEQLLSHWVWRLQERQQSSGTFCSSGWIGFLRILCSDFQLLSPKCKALKLGGSRWPLSTAGIGTLTFSPSSASLNCLLLCSDILSACKFCLFLAISRQSLTNLFVVH